MESKNIEMDEIAKSIVFDYVIEKMDKSDKVPLFDIYIVWKCKTLQNWKWLISTTLVDGKYYEVTFDGDKRTFYLDAYVKLENRSVPLEYERNDRKLEDIEK